MRYGSVCSGIEAASVAWKPLGWRAAFLSEIEAFPRAVLAHHHPGAPLRGDFTEIQAGDHEAIDVLVGGTPCQSFSIAGLRRGMADERGNLALEYLRLADRLRPKWLVWENVPGVLSSNGGRDFGAFLGGLVELGYGFAYRVLDAQYFGVAQRRRRVFVVGCAGDWRRAAAVLFEPASLRGDPAPRREARAGSAIGTLGGTSPGGGWRFGADEAAAWQLIAGTLTGRAGNASRQAGANSNIMAFGGNNQSGPIDVATALNACGTASGRQDFETETFIAHTLRAEGFDASEDGTGRGTPLVPVAASLTAGGHGGRRREDDTNLVAFAHPPAEVGMAVRRLTPRECERLQGFPDDYTLIPMSRSVQRAVEADYAAYMRRSYPDITDAELTRLAADGPRYKALGNSMAVPVMAWIGQRIQNVS